MIASPATAGKMCSLADTIFQTPLSLAALPFKNGDHVKALVLLLLLLLHFCYLLGRHWLYC